VRAAYIDLDGTLLGAESSLLRDAEGAFTLLGARALEACARAGVEVVFYSGRRQLTMFYDARMMGISSYAFEAGAGFVLDGELHWLTGDLVPRDGRSIFDQIEASGAPALLLERFAGRLEYHEPWHRGREVSHLFRGEVDAFEADELL
jgi:phosphoglycolate phosphatase